MTTPIDDVVDLMKRTHDGHGSVIVIEGGPGTGKTTLIHRLAERARQSKELANAQIVVSQCDQTTSSLDPYQPFAEILSSLVRTNHRDRDATPLIRTIVENCGQDLLPMLPDIGVHPNDDEMTFNIMTGLGLGVGRDRRSAKSVSIAAQFVKILLETAATFGPLVLAFDDAHWIDESSCYVLQRLAQTINRHPVTIILTLRPEALAERHPLRRIRPDLIRNISQEVTLPDRNAAAIPEQPVRETFDVEEERPISAPDHATIRPRRLVIEIAQRAEAGNDPATAATHYLLAARTSLRDGAGTETAELARRAATNAQRICDRTDQHDRLVAEALALNVAARELDWGTRTESQDEEDPYQLIALAGVAANRAGDPLLAAQLKFLAGKVLLTIENRPDAVATFEDALRDARNADDPLTEFLILAELGHHSAGGNVERARDILRQAMDLFQRRLQPNRSSLPIARDDLDRHYHHLLQVIGVAEFDLGNFDAAIRLLDASRRGVAASKLPIELERILNFLGQVYTATGQFEIAEHVLTEAIALELDRGIPGTSNPWRVYNRGQLGKLYLEWERLSDAAVLLAPAWEEAQHLTTASLKVLVANFYAEALIHPASQIRDEAKAETILHETATLAGNSGFFRSGVQAYSLLARLSLQQNQPLAALAFSIVAAEELQDHGTLPALRVEEIFFHHAQILQATSKFAEATSFLEKAHAVIIQKADTLRDPLDRQTFLDRVPLCREIRSTSTIRESHS